MNRIILFPWDMHPYKPMYEVVGKRQLISLMPSSGKSFKRKKRKK